MSGSDLPYHLRQNKTVDRDIFFSLLANLDLSIPINKYSYIGLGGPMLEDFRILHQGLGLTSLESIEKDPATFSRQKFNRPYRCINCEKLNTSEYIDNFDRAEPSIVWLDYTKPSWQPQFNDIHALLSKLDAYDILKVTFNANPEVLKKKSDIDSEPLDIFLQKAGGKFTSRNMKENDVKTMPRLSASLAEIFQTVTESALDVCSDLTFVPLLLFRYTDNRHHMLTITGIVMPKSDDRCHTNLLKELGLEHWGELSLDWKDIKLIDLPDLTSREKLFINSSLPHDNGDFDYESLPFQIDKNIERNKLILDNYLKYYRFSPSFQRTTY